MTLPELAVLGLATILLLIFSWKFSIRAKRYHGVFRFFSFEAIALLLMLNWRFWFVDSFSWNQIISWFLLIGSIPLAGEGFRLLRVIGRPEGQFEHTTTLVSVGIYKFIRHPLYASLILVGFGICFKRVSLDGVVLSLVNLVAMILTAAVEEKEMVRSFGAEYERYKQRTRMFIPYIL